MLFKFNTVIAQNGQFIDFSIAQRNLQFIYQTEADFENPKMTSDAFTLDIRAKSRRLLISARTISNLNSGLTTVPNNLFSIQLSGTNANINSGFTGLYNLDFTDQTILMYGERGNKKAFFDYDLHVAEIGYDYDPGQYFYSIIFTVTEQ